MFAIQIFSPLNCTTQVPSTDSVILTGENLAQIGRNFWRLSGGRTGIDYARNMPIDLKLQSNCEISTEWAIFNGQLAEFPGSPAMINLQLA